MFAAAAFVIIAQTSTPSPMPCGCQADAQITRAEYPDITEFRLDLTNQPLYATVAVTIAADGSVKKTTIKSSSGNLQFDMASTRAARLSAYKPKMVNCHPVESVVEFKTLAVQGDYTPPPAPSPTPSCPPPHTAPSSALQLRP